MIAECIELIQSTPAQQPTDIAKELFAIGKDLEHRGANIITRTARRIFVGHDSYDFKPQGPGDGAGTSSQPEVTQPVLPQSMQPMSPTLSQRTSKDAKEDTPLTPSGP